MGVGAEIGVGHVTILPKFQAGFGRTVAAQTSSAAKSAGTSAGTLFGRGMSDGAASGLKKGTGGGAFGGVLGVIGRGVAAIGFASMAVGGFRAGIETAAGMEQARISFTTMLRSADKADKFLRQLATFAANTPFDLPGLQESAASLISAGISADKVIPIMRTLGDVTSGMGTGAEGIQRATIALQQMNAAGRITGEDLNQLRDAGIPVYDLLAAATGKTKAQIVKLAQAGKLGKKELDQMMKALESGKGLERFNGLMAKQAKSLSGIWANLKETFSQGMAQAIMPLFPAIKAGLTGLATASGPALKALADGISWVVSAVQGLSGALGKSKIGSSLSAAFGPAFDGIKAAVVDFGANVLPVLSSAFAAIKANVEPMLPSLRELGGNVLGILVGAFGLLAAVIRAVGAGIKAYWATFGPTLVAVWGATWRAIVGILGPFLAIIQNAISLFTNLLQGNWSGVWNSFVGILKGAVDLIVAIVSGLGGLIWTALQGLWGALVSSAQSSGLALVALFQGMWANIKLAFIGGVVAVVGFFATLPGRLVGFLQALGPRLMAAANVALGLLRNAVYAGVYWTITLFVAFPRRAASALASLGGLIAGVARSAWASLHSAVVSGIASAVSFMAAFPGRARAAIAALPGLLRGVATSALSSFRSSILSGINTAISVIRTFPGKAKGALGNLGGLLVSAGLSVAQGLANGIRNGISWVTNAARSIAQAAVQAAKNALGIASPSKVFLSIGQNTAKGFVLGIGDNPNAAAAAGRRLAEAAIPGGAALGAMISTGRAGMPGLSVTVQGNVGWDPEEMARRLDRKRRDIYALAGVL